MYVYMYVYVCMFKIHVCKYVSSVEKHMHGIGLFYDLQDGQKSLKRK
jgi:hypothetical protein